MKTKKQLRLFFLMIALAAADKLNAQKALADSIITQELLQHYVQALAHDSMQGRYTGTEGCEKAAQFIASQMKTAGLSPLNSSDSNYLLNYTIERSSGNITAANVLGIIPGKIADRFIIFSAHYDHVGNADKHQMPGQFELSKKDRIYNGANDNASGVAAILAIAQYFKLRNQNDYTILFIAFSGEENGLLGSEALLKSFTNKKNILQVINLEMLGKISARNKKPFVTEGRSSYGFMKKLNSNLTKMDAGLKNNFFQNDWLSTENNFERSDNYTFAKQGIPANTIMATTGLDKHYHTPSDEWHTLNYEEMTTVVKAVALACSPMVITKN
ncbi:MAG: M20/M25/M40 family metallo-hydrolase [Sphingobacteriales bacterium]|nr:MAG: M20/M25/M40 family metallo-hydrolase [Sphingobacteriales bacterium]